jgi:small subunit ribosomal protein S17
MAEKSTIKKRQFEGTVVSTKMQKTVVVRVDRVTVHSKYNKRYIISKKYKAHDEKGQYAEGDLVIIEACRPISRDKRFRVVRKVVHGTQK